MVVPGSVQYTEIVKLERRRRIAVMRAASASGGNVSGSRSSSSSAASCSSSRCVRRRPPLPGTTQALLELLACGVPCADGACMRILQRSVCMDAGLAVWSTVKHPESWYGTGEWTVLLHTLFDHRQNILRAATPNLGSHPPCGRHPTHARARRASARRCASTWKDNAINVGKLMRYELVKELQHAVADDVEVECTGDPAQS